MNPPFQTRNFIISRISKACYKISQIIGQFIIQLPTYKGPSLILLISRNLPSGPIQASIPKMARNNAMNEVINELDIEMESMEHALRSLKKVKREIKRKSRSFRKELKKLYKQIELIERSVDENEEEPRISHDTKIRDPKN